MLIASRGVIRYLRHLSRNRPSVNTSAGTMVHLRWRDEFAACDGVSVLMNFWLAPCLRIIRLRDEVSPADRRQSLGDRVAFLRSLALGGLPAVQMWVRPRNHSETSLYVGPMVPSHWPLGGQVTWHNDARVQPAVLPATDWAVTLAAPIVTCRPTARREPPVVDSYAREAVEAADIGRFAQGWTHVPAAFGVAARPLEAARRATLHKSLLSQHGRRVETSSASYERRSQFDALEASLGLLDRGELWTATAFVGADEHSVATGLLDSLLAHLSTGWDLVLGDYTIAEGWSFVDDNWLGDVGADHLLATDAIAHLMRPPSSSLHGVAVVPSPRFGLTSPFAGQPPTLSVRLGDLIGANGQKIGPLNLPCASLRRHTLITGATGSGKTRTTIHMLKRLLKAGVPWLVVEPTKDQYAAAMADHPHVRTLRIGALGSAAVGLNPLAPEPGFPVHTHVDLLKALFVSSFEANEPFPQVVAAALDRVFEEYLQNNSATGFGTPDTNWPTLADLGTASLEVVRDVGYDRETAQRVSGFMKVRLDSLTRGSAGHFLAGGRSLLFDDVLRAPLILNLDEIGDDTDKRFLMGLIFLRLSEAVRVRGPWRDDSIRHVIVIEEAHRLLGHSRAAKRDDASLSTIANMLTEIRAYGEGLIVVDQSPSDLLSEVMKNTATKIMHQLPLAADREEMGSAMHCSPAHIAYAATLVRGEAICSTEGSVEPLCLRVPEHDEEEDDDSVRQAHSVLGTLASERAHSGCDDLCDRAPCTVLDRRRAAALADEWWFVLWVELSVTSLVIRAQTDDIERALQADLLGVLKRKAKSERAVLRCAIGSAVLRAVSARRRAFTICGGSTKEVAAGSTARLMAVVDDTVAPNVRDVHLPESPYALPPEMRSAMVSQRQLLLLGGQDHHVLLKALAASADMIRPHEFLPQEVSLITVFGPDCWRLAACSEYRRLFKRADA